MLQPVDWIVFLLSTSSASGANKFIDLFNPDREGTTFIGFLPDHHSEGPIKTQTSTLPIDSQAPSQTANIHSFHDISNINTAPMDMPQFEAGGHTYVIYRDVKPGESFDPTSPLAFFPPKNSDELFDALRLAFPHLKTHSERMRDAIIQFLLEERLGEQSQASPAMTMETMETSTATWPSVSTEYASSSAFTSPDLPTFSTPASFANSPQAQSAPLTRQVSSTASAQNSPPSLDQMTGVFSLSSSSQTKQRTRRKMTEAEKVEYQKRRIVKACDKCAKKKRKCVHNQSEMQTLSSSSSAKVAKSTSSRSAKATKVSTSPPKQYSYDTNLDMPGIDAGAMTTNVGAENFNTFDDPLPELTLDDFINLEHFQHDYMTPYAQDHFAPSSFSTMDPWADFTLLDPVPHGMQHGSSPGPFNGSVGDDGLHSQSRAAAQIPDLSSTEQSEAPNARETSNGHQHARRTVNASELHSLDMRGSFLSPHDVQHVPRPPRQPIASASIDVISRESMSIQLPSSLSPTATGQDSSRTASFEAHASNAGSFGQVSREEPAQQNRLPPESSSARSRADSGNPDVSIHSDLLGLRPKSAPLSTSGSAQSVSPGRGVSALQGWPSDHTSAEVLGHITQTSTNATSLGDGQGRSALPGSLTLGEGLRLDASLSMELYRLRRRIPPAGRRNLSGKSELNSEGSDTFRLQTIPGSSSAPLSSRQGSSPAIMLHFLANDHADVRPVSQNVIHARTARHVQTSSSSDNVHAEVRPFSRDIRDIRTAHQLASAASGNAASASSSLGVYEVLRSDHKRCRDHHGRTSGLTPTVYQNWIAAGVAICALFVAAMFLMPSVSISMAVLALVSPASSSVLPGLSSPDEAEHSASSKQTMSKQAMVAVDFDRALKGSQHLRGSGGSTRTGVFDVGAQGWLTGLMYPFELAPMRFTLV